VKRDAERNFERPELPPPAGASHPDHHIAGKIADTVLRKAAAFDDLSRWLAEQSGAPHYTDAMGPEWVVSTLKDKLTSLIEDGHDFRSGRRRPAWLRRSGW
jgi:hypothetical protein